MVYYCGDNETLDILLELLVNIFLETKEEATDEADECDLPTLFK